MKPVTTRKPRKASRTVTEQRLACIIATDLFTDGFGKKAARLVFDYAGTVNETGWSIECLRDRILKNLQKLPIARAARRKGRTAK